MVYTKKPQPTQANKHDVAGLKVLAAQTLKIASINGLGRLDKLEHELEDEINYENRSPKTRFGRFRQRGEHYLHSKAVLFVIVLLNIIDTLLVMIGMILDFHHVSLELGAKSEMLKSFVEELGKKYRIQDKEAEVLQGLLNARIVFNETDVRESNVAVGCYDFLNRTASRHNLSMGSYMTQLPSAVSHETDLCFQPYSGNDTYHLSSTGEVESTLSTVAHKLHYCSISILSLLVIILLLKLICFGKRFFKERVLVFDGLITIISFVLDIVFMNDVLPFSKEQVVIILTLLFPWRVIRILNSLIAAVLDKHKLNLKILYTQKKKISRTLTETHSKVEVLQRHIEVLQGLCSSRGIGDHDISRALSGDSSGGSQKNGPGGGLASMMALGKLAFQAADAFAPISNGYKKNKGGSSPALSSQASSVFNSPTRSTNEETATINDNNNANLKNQNDKISNDPKTDRENSVSSPEPYANSETVTVHINGTGPPKEREPEVKNHASIDLQEQAHDDDDGEVGETQFDSRL